MPTANLLTAFALGWVLTMFPAGESAPNLRDFPVVGPTDYADAHHDYTATDIFAECGRKVVAPVSGTVLEVGRVDRWDPLTNHGGQRGGKFFSIRGEDGVRYYGSHLSGLRAGIEPGATVRTGEHIGWVGRTGSARYTPCHLHFALSPVCQGVGQWWIRRGAVSPYRFLTRWERGGDRSPVLTVRAWKARHGCPAGPD